MYDAIEEQIGGERRQAVVMQLVNGKSLRQLLDEQKRLSPDLTIHIGACVAAALDCAHRAHLVHRDVSPENLQEQAAKAREGVPVDGAVGADLVSRVAVLVGIFALLGADDRRIARAVGGGNAPRDARQQHQ